MTNDRVEDLLKDLDDALDVSPAPETIVKVRARIAEQSSSRWPWLSWRVVAAVAAGVAIVVIGYLQWTPRAASAPPQVATVIPPVHAPPPTVEPPAHQTPTLPAPAARTVTASSAARQARAIDDERLRVIVSPDQRRGIEQLQAAARAGRITDKSFADSPVVIDAADFEITTVEISSATIEPTKVEPPGSATGGGSIR